MTDAERLARAVLLFHSNGMWSTTKQSELQWLTNQTEATTKTLCDLARRILQKVSKP